MKLQKDGSTEMLEFPIEETEKIIEAIGQAEEDGDLPALKWCARRLQWLYDESDVTSAGENRRAVRLFNAAWDAQVKSDPPPQSIAAIIVPSPHRKSDDCPDYTEADIRIGNRSDALALLDEMLGADMVMCTNTALKKLRDAIEREVI